MINRVTTAKQPPKIAAYEKEKKTSQRPKTEWTRWATSSRNFITHHVECPIKAVYRRVGIINHLVELIQIIVKL
jgi:hypothetical protein